MYISQYKVYLYTFLSVLQTLLIHGMCFIHDYFLYSFLDGTLYVVGVRTRLLSE